MSKRHLSMSPSAVRARDQRLYRMVEREEAKFNAEIRAHMEQGLSFEGAWIAAGGIVISHNEQKT